MKRKKINMFLNAIEIIFSASLILAFINSPNLGAKNTAIIMIALLLGIVITEVLKSVKIKIKNVHTFLVITEVIFSISLLVTFLQAPKLTASLTGIIMASFLAGIIAIEIMKNKKSEKSII